MTFDWLDQRRAQMEACRRGSAAACAVISAALCFTITACGPEASEETTGASESASDAQSGKPASSDVGISDRGAGRVSDAVPSGEIPPAAKDASAGGAQAERQADAGNAADEELLVELSNPDPAVRVDAIWALMIDEEDDTAVDHRARVIALLAADPDASVRAAAAERLGEIQSEDSTAALVAALSDPDPDVIVASIDSLEGVEDPRLLPALQTLLGVPNDEIREAAAIAIEVLGP